MVRQLFKGYRIKPETNQPHFRQLPDLIDVPTPAEVPSADVPRRQH